MAKVKETTIVINSAVLTETQLEEKRKKVKKWQDFGYNTMAILYFLEQEGFAVSATHEATVCIVNLG